MWPSFVRCNGGGVGDAGGLEAPGAARRRALDGWRPQKPQAGPGLERRGRAGVGLSLEGVRRARAACYGFAFGGRPRLRFGPPNGTFSLAGETAVVVVQAEAPDPSAQPSGHNVICRAAR